MPSFPDESRVDVGPLKGGALTPKLLRAYPCLVWLSGLGILPPTEKSQVPFPIRAPRAWAAGQGPG